MVDKVALILLNWNTAALTATCIRSILKYCSLELLDIIVADNGSADDSLNLLRGEFPQLIYIDNKENLGFAGGNNTALNYSIANSYGYSLLMNTDTEVDEDFLTPLLNFMAHKPEIGAVQPAIYFLHDKTKLWNGGSFFSKFWGVTYSKKQKSRQLLSAAGQVDWITGCCMLVRNEALTKSGLFNERFFLYYEDVDLSFRLRQSGYRLFYYPAAKIYHEAGASGKQKAKTSEGILSPVIHYYLCRNKIWFLRRYGKAIFAPFMIAHNAIYYGALFGYFFLRGRKKKAEYLYKGIKEGFTEPLTRIWP